MTTVNMVERKTRRESKLMSWSVHMRAAKAGVYRTTG